MNVSSEHINWEQFKRVFNSVIRNNQPSGVNLLGDDSLGDYSPDNYSPGKVVHWIQKLVHHKSFIYLSIVMMVVHVAVITIEMEVDYVNVIRHCNSVLAYTNLFFSVYYTVEQILKIVGLGNTVYSLNAPAKKFCVCAYLHFFDRAYEFFITLLVVLTEVVILLRFGVRSSDPQPSFYSTCIRIMNLLVVLRLLGIISMIPHILRVFSMMVEILKNLRPFATVILAIYYLYALLGMEIFGRNYRLDNEHSARNNICGTYEQQGYFAYNFHDFASSLVLLWNLMVVNNWYVFKDAFVHATSSKWTQLYFISWWLLSVVITLNLFISLVIEIFVTQWEKEKERFGSHGDNRSFLDGEEADVEQRSADRLPQHSGSDDIFLMLHHSFKEPTETELQLEIDKHTDLS